MKFQIIRIAHFVSIFATILLLRHVAFAQTYTTVSSVFAGGGGVITVGPYTLSNVIGQGIVGASPVGSNTNGSGFLFQYGGSVGPPPHTGIFSVSVVSDTGDGSLRAALTMANSTAGLNIINFNIPGGGVHTIILSSPLPQITDATIIDGYTQPGASPNTNGPGLGTNAVVLIELDGTNAGSDGCLDVRTYGATIRGLAINRSPGPGIRLRVGGNHIVEGNFIGTDATGTVARGNTYGITVDFDDNDRIGGTIPAARNLISGNTSAGVGFGVGGITGGAGHLVQGNLIGTNASGTAAIGNGWGIQLAWNTNNVLIGGMSEGAGNVISGNTTGVTISSGLGVANVSRNLVLGNYVGTDVTGTSGIGNTQDGIAIFSMNNRVGGTTPEERNIISGNGRNGVHVFSGDSSVVQGNYVGTDVSGVLPLGNRGIGVYLTAHNVLVGGTEPGAGNIIAFNGTEINAHAGVVLIGASTRNGILGNSIHSNVGLGIDLGGGSFPNGVTLNDTCDVDSLIANNYQNFPNITSAFSIGGTTTIEGTLNSTPNTIYRVEFFSSPVVDTSLNGEGMTYLGFADVTTAGNCWTSFSVSLPVAVPPMYYVSATATDPDLNTSEFSGTGQVGTTSVHEPGYGLPAVFSLAQNYPNPFNPTTTIEYHIPARDHVSIKIFDLLGREVATLANEEKSAGMHSVAWDASGLGSGIYIYRLHSGGSVATRRMMVLK